MPWARLDDMLPVHPKVRALTDSAFRLYISAICWSNCNQTDGHIPSGQLRFVSDVHRPRTRADQLVQAGLWETADDGWRIHDYLEYQPSAEKVKRERELKRQRQERWRAHVEASQDPSEDGSSRARPHPIPSLGGSVVDQPSGSNGRLPAEETLINAVQQAMAGRIQRHITDSEALAIAAKILGSESVRNPAAYINAAISRDANPARFLPTRYPTVKPVEEVLPPPTHQPARGDTVHGIAAQARKAITRQESP